MCGNTGLDTQTHTNDEDACVKANARIFIQTSAIAAAQA